MNTKKFFRLISGLFFAILFLWLIARQVDLKDIENALDGIHFGWVIGAVIAFFSGYALRIERWRLMLKVDAPQLVWKDCAGPFFVSFSINNIFPFRAGDVLRTFAFSKHLGVSSGIIVATLFVERLLDLLMIVIFLCISLFIFQLDSNLFFSIGSVTLALIIAAIMIFLFFPKVFVPFLKGLCRFLERVSPNFGRKVTFEINKSINTLQHLSGGGTMVKLMALSFLAWLAEGFVFWFAALALPSSISIAESAWFAMPVGTLSTLIPSTPGYVGTFDYFVIRAMIKIGNSLPASTAYAMLVHLLIWLPPTIVGGLFILLRPLKKRNGLNVS